jgi:hypothetical protein
MNIQAVSNMFSLSVWEVAQSDGPSIEPLAEYAGLMRNQLVDQAYINCRGPQYGFSQKAGVKYKNVCSLLG